jgi:hypothetical protein
MIACFKPGELEQAIILNSLESKSSPAGADAPRNPER